MRTRFETSQGLDAAQKSLNEGLSKFSPALHIRPTAQKPRALVLVTKESHCLRDLMYLLELGELPIEIPLVISNREELKSLVESHGIPFLHLPVTAANKADQEKVMLTKIAELRILQPCQERSLISITHSCQDLKVLSLITRHMNAA
jgi:formyltetrahydrofolate deformylase